MTQQLDEQTLVCLAQFLCVANISQSIGEDTGLDLGIYIFI